MNYQKKVNATSAKGLKKDLIDKFSILNGAKYFSLRMFQNYLVFIPAKKYISILVTLLGLNRGNLVECYKKVWKVLLNQTRVLHQLFLILIYY